MRCNYVKCCQLNAEFYVVLAKPFITIGKKNSSFSTVLSGKIKHFSHVFVPICQTVAFCSPKGKFFPGLVGCDPWLLTGREPRE